MNTIEETKIEDDPFSITTPPPSPPSLLNHHHQRLSYSISFNNNNHHHHSSSTLLHRSQSLALDDQHYKKKKPNHLNKLWKNHHIDKELPITPTIILSQSPMDRILATSPPTLIEFHQWILHYLSNIEETINIELLNIQHHQHNNNHQEIISKLVIAKDCLLRLINTLDDKLVLKTKIINKLHSISFQSMGINEILQVIYKKKGNYFPILGFFFSFFLSFFLSCSLALFIYFLFTLFFSHSFFFFFFLP